MFDAFIPAGLALIAQWQQLSPALDLPMQAITFLGSLEFYLILLPFIYWTLDPALATRTFSVLLLNDFVSTTGKILWHGPRPYWLAGVASELGDAGHAHIKTLATEGSYGVPSGHAGGSLVTWAYLATQVRRPGFQLIALLLILLIGFSRPYLGVHFPHDVVLGWLIGGAILLLVLSFQVRVGAYLSALTDRNYVLLACIVAAAMMAWGVLVPTWIADAPDPAAWASHAASARSPAHFFALAGTVFGLMIGVRRLRQRAAYVPAAAWSRRLSCFAVGSVGMFTIYVGVGLLSHLFSEPESGLSFVLRFIRFALVAWWISELAPRWFIRLGLTND